MDANFTGHVTRARVAPWLCALTLALIAMQAQAVGTTAGREIDNVAQANFDIGGVPQTAVSSNTVVVFVDELIDVTLVSDDGGPIGVATPDTDRILQFTVTNVGNGTETFRIVGDAAVAGDQFDPAINQLYLESNALVGLQTGAGGDTVYIAGSNDPTLLADEALIAYVQSNIPAALVQNDQGFVELRAVSLTIVVQAGTDDPTNPAWPAVGDQYPGAGDLDESGGGNVTAVVGTTHDTSALVLRAQGIYQVSDAVVTVTKSVVTVTDPFGGSTVVPGAVIAYQILVAVAGSGTAESLVITDIVDASLAYEAGTLSASALPPGEDADDDFAPAGVDNTGFDSPSTTLTVTLGDVVGGSAVTIDFQAAIR